MESSCIPLTRVPKSSALLTDYLYHYDRIAPFYSGSPFDLSSYKALAAGLRNLDHNRRELTEILRRQNEAFGCGEQTFANIRRLSEPETFAVVTGQQVGLLSGPAFTLYKALTAVRISQWLSEQGLTTVPVFWLATEDHDLEEVAATAVLDEEHNLVTLSDSGERPSPRCSVGYVKLSAGISEVIERVKALLPAGEPSDRLLEDLRTSYVPGATWGQAFGRFMARLFSRWGVVLLDPLDEAMHGLSARIYERALVQAEELRRLLTERSQVLVRAKYHAQVHVADDSTMVFGTREGDRVAISQPAAQADARRTNEFVLDGTSKFTLGDLKGWIKKRPLDFTPNALLRPIVQDSLLPTLAYVAGPSELAYLAQAQAVYPEFGRPMPVVFPRAGFTLLDRRVERLMGKYTLSLNDAWQGEEHLGRKIAAASFPGSETESWTDRFDRCQQEVARLLDGLRRDIERVDPTLVDSLGRAQEKMMYQLDRLKGKASRAALDRSELLTRHEQLLLRYLFPRKSLQEREVSGVYYLGRAGYELLDLLLSKIQLRCADHQAVTF